MKLGRKKIDGEVFILFDSVGFGNHAKNLLGLILFLFLLRKNHRVFHGAVIITWKLGSSLSLEMLIFTARPYDLKLIRHEYGHTVQSLILGPIWSFVIGLPSLI